MNNMGEHSQQDIEWAIERNAFTQRYCGEDCNHPHELDFSSAIDLKDNITVTESEHINEWLVGISKQQADMVIDTVNKLNATGIMKKIQVQCTACEHTWEDPLNFDPTSFFVKRS